MGVLVGSLLAAATAGAQTVDEVRVEGRTYRGTIVETRPRISAEVGSKLTPANASNGLGNVARVTAWCISPTTRSRTA